MGDWLLARLGLTRWYASHPASIVILYVDPSQEFRKKHVPLRQICQTNEALVNSRCSKVLALWFARYVVK